MSDNTASETSARSQEKAVNTCARLIQDASLLVVVGAGREQLVLLSMTEPPAR